MPVIDQNEIRKGSDWYDKKMEIGVIRLTLHLHFCIH
jgi:hypothetical protein